jgi:hypothetical protein
MTDTRPVADPVYPEGSDADDIKLACMVPGCTQPANTHLILIDVPDEHHLPVCVDHHLEYSQPGHLKHLKSLAGLDEEKLHVHQPGDQIEGFQGSEQGPAGGSPSVTEPGPEVVKPTKRQGARSAGTGGSEPGQS